VKVIKAKGSINKDNKIIHVKLVPAYTDLYKGVWNISLSTYCFKVNEPAQLETVYAISSTLCTSIELSEIGLPVSGLTTLGHIYAVCPQGNFVFGQFENQWFTIDHPNSSQFQLIFSPVKMTEQATADIEVEITILFQRVI